MKYGAQKCNEYCWSLLAEMEFWVVVYPTLFRYSKIEFAVYLMRLNIVYRLGIDHKKINTLLIHNIFVSGT